MIFLLLSCASTDAPAKEPAIHDDPPVEGANGMAFTDATDAWGLSTINGAQMQAVDLDGDGYPDLVMDDNNGIDDDAENLRYHWVLMNRDDGSGGRTFVDQTDESGFFQRRSGEGRRPSVDHVFADVDGDGDLDGFAGVFNDPHSDPVGHFTDTSEILLNDGTGHFSLAPQSPDLAVDFPMSGVTFTDVNADGNVDLFIALWYKNADIYGNGSWLNWTYGANDRLLLGQGDGTFADATDAAGMEMKEGTSGNATETVLDGRHARPSMGATACDLDGDALPELLAMAYGRQWNLQWHNLGAGKFEEVGQTSGYAGDTNVDYTDNWYYECSCWTDGTCVGSDDPTLPYNKKQCAQVAAYWNAGWDDQPANLNGNTFATACADLDNDGDLDLLNGEITHQWAGGSSDLSGVLLNDGNGVFARLDLASSGLARKPVPDPNNHSWDFGDQKAAIADLDNDGRKDVLLPSGAAYYGNILYIWRQWNDLQFSEVETDIGIQIPTAHGVALADFDRDGDLDLVGASLSELVGDSPQNHRVYFYENETPPRHFLRVRLNGSGTNTTGIGARVAVTALGHTQVQEVVGGFGQHGMQMEPVLTFGLGPAVELEGVEVTWVGGDVDTFEGAEVDTQVVLSAGGGVNEE